MKNCFYFCILFTFFGLTACRKNPVYQDKIGKIKTVVILGNSLVLHPSLPSIGWYHDWGMAATARDSDFVHRLIADIHAKDPSVIIKFQNIGDFERGYWKYDYTKLDTLKNADILIMRIGENVFDGDAEKNGFIRHYNKLIQYLSPGVVVVTDGFWRNVHVNSLIKNYAVKKELPYIELSELSDDNANKAIGKYSYQPIQQHPNDRGMRLIAAEIWHYLYIYFN